MAAAGCHSLYSAGLECQSNRNHKEKGSNRNESVA